MSIQDELAAVQAQGGQGALNEWLAKTQYTPAELNAATGYNVSDIQSAINAAQMAVSPYDFANDNIQQQAIAEKWSPEYAATQDDLYSMRQLMAQQGAGYMTDSLSNGASTYAYLPGMASKIGVAVTPGMSSAYERATGGAYQPGAQVTGFDVNTGKYELGSAGSQPTGGLTQVATSIQTPITSPALNQTPASQSPKAVSDGDIQSWFTYNPGWTPETLKAYMASYGITPEQMARATGNLPEVMIERYNRVGRQAPQSGAQTGYVDYTQPLAPIPVSGSGDLPYYYNTPAGQVGSYMPSSYWRGNAPAYGGMVPHVTGQATPARPVTPAPAPAPVYVPSPPAPAPTPASQAVTTQADFDRWYADYVRRQAALGGGSGGDYGLGDDGSGAAAGLGGDASVGGVGVGGADI